jgi:DNA-binding NtrC family response regulator
VLAILLKNSGFEVTSVVNGREAIGKLQTSPFELCILDHDMPELDGLATLQALRGFAPELPVVVCSGTLSPEVRARYEQHKIEAAFEKPLDPRRLREQIPAILERRRRAGAKASGGGGTIAPFMVLGESDAALEKPVFAGGSAQVRKLVADFGRIRDFKTAATITGGPGAAFLDIAVAAAEEKDAVLLACPAAEVGEQHLAGLFENALTHTRPVLLIVLNAEKLDPAQQDLLDAFIGGEAAGALAPFNGRARVILCAEASLSALADAGEFNESLLMRAGAMKLAIPRLAQRREDLPFIARAIVRRVGGGRTKFGPEAHAWLERTDWPGDYVQLHRTVELALAAADEEPLVAETHLLQAQALEPAHAQPLYHDVLRASLCSPLAAFARSGGAVARVADPRLIRPWLPRLPPFCPRPSGAPARRRTRRGCARGPIRIRPGRGAARRTRCTIFSSPTMGNAPPRSAAGRLGPAWCWRGRDSNFGPGVRSLRAARKG